LSIEVLADNWPIKIEKKSFLKIFVEFQKDANKASEWDRSKVSAVNTLLGATKSCVQKRRLTLSSLSLFRQQIGSHLLEKRQLTMCFGVQQCLMALRNSEAEKQLLFFKEAV